MSFQGQCAHCGSFDLVAGQDMYQCLKCGFHTTADGATVAPPAPGEEVSWFGRSNIDGGKFNSQES